MSENNEIQNNPKESLKVKLKNFFTSWSFWRPFIAIVIGSTMGYLYYHYIGCNSGSCGVTSNPYMSTFWGGLLGFFLVNSPCSRGRC
jgi:hypothetical protein